MNIGEKFYCSRCLAELHDEIICPKCGHDPRSTDDEYALEEGTTLKAMRFHVGAIRKKLKCGYFYGAFDYFREKPVYIFEYFPALGLKREEDSGSRVIIPERCQAEFEEGMRKLMAGLKCHHNIFCENNTLYAFRS